MVLGFDSPDSGFESRNHRHWYLHEIVTVRIRPVDLLFSLPPCGKEPVTQALFPGGGGGGGQLDSNFLAFFGTWGALLDFFLVSAGA